MGLRLPRGILPVLLGCCAIPMACTEPVEVTPVGVTWLEWPAEVLAAAPFDVRVVFRDVDCGVIANLVIPVTVDTAAVLIEPRFTILERRDLECFAGPALLDTLVQVPGLAVATPRTFTMRATAPLLPGEIAVPESPPPHRHDFGTLTVWADSADASRRDAAGLAAFFTDSLGCQRVAPFQVYSASSHGYVSPGSYPLGNPDSTIPSYVRYFVTGAVRRAPASMCGDTLLFDLTSH